MSMLRNFLEKININAECLWEEPLAGRTSFGIGGPAEALVRPLDAASAAALVSAARAEGIAVFFLGGGANILVGDRGLRGIVLDCKALRWLRFGYAANARELVLEAGAGLSIDELCLEALCAGQGGLENFAGMPGSVGGAVFMNARCYDREMADILAWIDCADAQGRIRRLPMRPADWGYKRSPLQPGQAAAGSLVVAAGFRLAKAEPALLAAVMRERRADREAKGHYRLPSAGSVFKNDRRFGKPTGMILDELGFRGRSIGGAAVSDWHANIFVNRGGASAADMRGLIELAQNEARKVLGIELEAEVLMVGDF